MQRLGVFIPLILVGCAAVQSPVGREVDLVVYPHFSKASQAIVNLKSLSSIATLDIVPYLEVTTGNYSPISSVTGNATTYGAADMLKLTQASPSIDPNRPFIIRKLKANQNYRVWARAYDASNALISKDNASFVDVAVANNDTPAMANLPISLVDVSFGASLAVDVQTDGRYDYLKGTLYLVNGNIQLAMAQTHWTYPQVSFGNLQGNTSYRLLVESYKLGTMMASNSVDLNITNDTAPSTASVPLVIPYVTTTLAGNAAAGGTDGVGGAASFSAPHGVALDLQGNIYVAEFSGNRIRKVTPTGTVTTLAGNGTSGCVDAAGADARFANPCGIAVDPTGNVFVADCSNHRIRKITPAGVVSTFAGNATPGLVDATGIAASFNGPHALVFDAFGNLIVSEYGNHRIRKIDPNAVVTTIAGSVSGYADGTGTSAMFNRPVGLAVDGYGNIFTVERDNSRVRKITPAGVVTTIAGNGNAVSADGTGTAATFTNPDGIAVDGAGNLYVADRQGNRIRKINSAGVVKTIAGNGNASFADGTGTLALFNACFGITIDPSGNLYVGDIGNNRIRKMQ